MVQEDESVYQLQVIPNIAQLEEQQAVTLQVAGSSPAVGISFAIFYQYSINYCQSIKLNIIIYV